MTDATILPLTPPVEAASDPRPVVALPRGGMPTWGIAALVMLASLLVFAALTSRRVALAAEPNRVSADGMGANGFPAPPPLRLDDRISTDAPPADRPAPVAVAAIQSPRMAAPAYVPSENRERRTADTRRVEPSPNASLGFTPAPSMGGGNRGGGGQISSGSSLVLDLTGPGGSGDAAGNNSAPMSNDDAIRATVIRARSSVIAEGTLIAATLETPIDSTRPGMIRAVVARDVRGFDGKRVLIPSGSRLIGDYKSEVQAGQRQVLAIWTRLIRPDGVSIKLTSPASDAMGGAGIPGKVSTNFLSRFLSAVLQSALTVGVNLASRTGDNAVVIGLPGQVGSATSQVLPTPAPRRTVKVAPGAPVSVFVAQDLDFGGVPRWH